MQMDLDCFLCLSVILRSHHVSGGFFYVSLLTHKLPSGARVGRGSGNLKRCQDRIREVLCWSRTTCQADWGIGNAEGREACWYETLLVILEPAFLLQQQKAEFYNVCIFQKTFLLCIDFICCNTCRQTLHQNCPDSFQICRPHLRKVLLWPFIGADVWPNYAL